jgi:hypothetical protein
MTVVPPADLRVIYLAPHSGSSGVGDYADDFVTALRPHVREIVEFRHGAARSESALGIWRERRRLHALIKQYDDGSPLIVHSEFSGGAVVPFWATLGLKVPCSATLHDAPRPVWYLFLTRGVSKGRVLNQAIHRPLHWFLVHLERRALREIDLFVLTPTGARATRELRMGRSVTEAALIAPRRPDLLPASQRPLAVGLFGHVYKGKGFNLVPELRTALPAEIALRVAGRGTEALKPVPGVEILGPVEGDQEDAFFASIRVLLMPYGRPPVGGRAMLPASATHLRALAYETPTLALRTGDTEHLEAAGLTAAAAGGAIELAGAAADLVNSAAALDDLSAALHQARTAAEKSDPAEPFLKIWSSR